MVCFESADKKIFIGTTEGLMVYDREKERKTSAASIYITLTSIEINDVAYPYQPSFVLPYIKV